MASKKDILEAKKALSSRYLTSSMSMESSYVALASRNIHTVGVGNKIVEGNKTKAKSIRIYVRKKLPGSLIFPRDNCPRRLMGYLWM